MNKKEKYEPPKRDKKDAIHTMASAAVSAIPYVGGASLEILKTIIPSSIERRRCIWEEEVSKGLRELENKAKLDINKIQEDEEFMSVYIQASWVAIRNHQKEKHVALKNALINSALKTSIDINMQLLYIRYVDELTPIHLLVLRYLIDNEKALEREVHYETIYKGFKMKTESDIDEMLFKLLCEDLRIRGLIRISENMVDFPGINREGKAISFGDKNDRMIATTNIGIDFIKYLSSIE